MTFKALLSAVALVVTPVASFAACSGHSEQAMTCAQGSVFDAETGTCKVVTG